MSTGATYADVVEGVRAAISAYTQALDDGRTDDVVATFCLLGKEGWKIQLVGRYHDVLYRDDRSWRFHRRTATFVTPDS
jgi:hypothetical protein